MAYREACHRGLFLFDRILEKTAFVKEGKSNDRLVEGCGIL